MEEYLSFVSIDTWTIILSWGNLLLLFLLLKKFLFKPINRILDARAEEIENTYKTAENTKSSAEELRDAYEEKLQNAKSEADDIIKSAVKSAELRSDSIVNEASQRANHIMEKTQKQIEQDKKNAVDEARSDIAAMAVEAAEKLIGKSLDIRDDEKLISDIIDKL